MDMHVCVGLCMCERMWVWYLYLCTCVRYVFLSFCKPVHVLCAGNLSKINSFYASRNAQPITGLWKPTLNLKKGWELVHTCGGNRTRQRGSYGRELHTTLRVFFPGVVGVVGVVVRRGRLVPLYRLTLVNICNTFSCVKYYMPTAQEVMGSISGEGPSCSVYIETPCAVRWNSWLFPLSASVLLHGGDVTTRNILHLNDTL